MIDTSWFMRVRAACVFAAILGFTLCAEAAAPESRIHPQSWPQTRSKGLIDKATEARITRLIARMSLEEKVGQVIQTDIAEIEPADLRRFPLGSILAGGGSGPNKDDRAPAPVWLQAARDYRAVSLEARPGHTPIPRMLGIDTADGHCNIRRAT